MKKIILLPILATMALSLTACGGHFAKTQTTEQQNQPLDCTGLHMKHGNFEFLVDGKKVAVTKFIKDKEEKTSCSATAEKTRDPLEKCLAKVGKN